MKFILKNTVTFAEAGGLRVKRAGSTVDDAQEDAARLRAAGAILLPYEENVRQAEAHLALTRGGRELDLLFGDHGQRRWKGETSGVWVLANETYVRGHRSVPGRRYNAATEDLQQVESAGGVLYAE